MERLTERNKNGLAMAACCGKDCEYNYVCEVGGFCECRGMDDIIDRLAAIEDILGDDYDLDRLRELVQSDREGRVNILPECVGKNCGTCANFNRVSGSRHGTCKVRKHPVNRYGQENKEIEFQPVQSRIACKKYISEKEELKGEQDG